MTGHGVRGEVTGISLAPHAPLPDWRALAADRSVTFASISVTENSNWVDRLAAAQLADAVQAGVYAGIRHRGRPGAPQDQARHVVQVGKSLGAFTPGTLAPTLDARAEGLDDRFVRTWIRTLRQEAVIRRVLVYAEVEHWHRRFRPEKWADDDVVLWSAWHNGVPGRAGWFHPRLGLHEHTADGRIGHHALVYPFTLTDVLV
ncbi:GH25 family lysozyme [Saccharomonospora azurea]|uniref:Glycosyl hydrolase family 25 n=1 Tax=Saccharomonospora azurea NA-128 TaxID=882081 RepID=H8GEJ1_9PSEU|nr:GH25 family lysozyme [Saccharomonospora azurea]EHK88917.1 lysozyme M1 precursor [Saccharomonospora azurea SZMC 14600]EHY88936.1 glycosyl hydrolase family 25 [Saccharomonospora azurea NA-128]